MVGSFGTDEPAIELTSSPTNSPAHGPVPATVTLPQPRMPPKIAKLAGLGAFAACAGIAALFLLFVYGTRPTASSGMDGTLRLM